jgi:hypothetical protein
VARGPLRGAPGPRSYDIRALFLAGIRQGPFLRYPRPKSISKKGPQNWRSLHGTPHGKPGQAGQVGSPEFPVERCGYGQLRVVLFRENHISGR